MGKDPTELEPKEREGEMLRLILAFSHAPPNVITGMSEAQNNALSDLLDYVMAHPWVDHLH